MKKIAFFFLALGLTLTSCNDDDDNNVTPTPAPKTIAEIASADANFSILVDALTRTNLVGAVADANASLTVFAPNNAAFTTLFQEVGVANIAELETAIGTDALANVLLYHVIGAKVMAADVSTGFVTTLATGPNDANLSAFISTASGVRINNTASVIQTDIEASNGVIHAIDRVYMPATIAQLATYAGSFTNLLTAAGVADGGIDSTLSDATAGPFTLFAPNDDAFAALLTELQLGSLNDVVAAIGTDGLADVLLYHVLAGNVRSNQVVAGDVTALNGSTFNISTTGGVTITDLASRTSNVVAFDVQGTNGVVHVIDRVIIPGL